MLFVLLLSAIACHAWLARAAPQIKINTDMDMGVSPPCYTDGVVTKRGPGQGMPPTREDCAKGGQCDCSRIQDTNSEQFFQCVTDPICELCWVTRNPSNSA
ncbi:hypothetical protein E4U21_005993 [Claviceps maximensis]|nr:hypothetical protein E4U21_005993 [Claviceps maximensis]